MSETKDNSVQIYKKLKRYFLEREIANFYKYLNTLDKELILRHQDLLTNLDTSDSDLKEINKTDEHRNELINLKVESEQIIGFTNLLRQSFITSLYSFMELWLIRECHLDSKHRDGGNSLELNRSKRIKQGKKVFR